MTVEEYILDLSPDQLRNVARCIDPKGAAELREAADQVERHGTYSVIRAAYKVTWKWPMARQPVAAKTEST